jgi:hypothetical protein
MKSLKYILLILVSASLIMSCGKEDEDTGDYFIVMGHSSGAYFFSDLTHPDTTYLENTHIDKREIDLDGDFAKELYLVSTYTEANDTIIRSLTLELHPQADTSLKVALTDDPEIFNVDYYFDGERVDADLENMTRISGEFILAKYEKIISTGAENTEGEWNGRQENYFLVSFYNGNDRYFSWVNVSVSDYDKYIFYDYATFLVP